MPSEAIQAVPTTRTGSTRTRHDADVIQLRKACRLLDACRLLRDLNCYHTSVIEMSFAAIERTLEFYALATSNDAVDDFREDHDRAYDRSADLGLLRDETARRRTTVIRFQPPDSPTRCSSLR